MNEIEMPTGLRGLAVDDRFRVGGVATSHGYTNIGKFTQ
jgi:hypothetical protein